MSTWKRGWDLPLLYAVAVTGVSVWVAARPDARQIVLDLSTNLDNMRSQPLRVLGLSLLVVSPLWFLALLPPLAVAYRFVVTWLGRIALVVAVLICHVGASLLVMVAEILALDQRLVSPAIASRHDVGVSYGLAGVIGLLLFRVPTGRWRVGYGLASLAGAIVLIVSRSAFSAIGHVSAWLIGLGLGWLVWIAGRRAASATPPPAAGQPW